ncbi:hypothetical protein N665_0069s0048 [Sinapis alba]|nr:hypothetical protein N665_0069s0048 [Sinapis alba]
MHGCRNKCGGCYRQFNKKEHLVEHMRTSYHSVHEPTCGICNKHCRSFDSLREHLIGPLPKQKCKNIFSICGCRFCLAILESPNARRIHQERCQFSNVNYGLTTRMAVLGLRENPTIDYTSSRSPRVVALSCKMVGGGSDGSLDLCARVCITDESENVIFHTYVKPTLPITNYRYETTGIRAENIRDAMPLKQAQRKIKEFLCNGEPMWKSRPRSGKARILVGHGLDSHLDCLQLEYSSSMIRYDIHVGIQDPYEDCVATMRLYIRMRYQKHKTDAYPLASDTHNRNNYAYWKQNELESMSEEELLNLSRSDYYCWCLDSSVA